MKKRIWIQGMTVAGIAAAIPMLSTSVAFAGTSFETQYQNNASVEASLLQTAEASNIDSADISSLQNAVTNINAQISTLYNSEQSLAATQVNIPQIDSDTLHQQIRELKQQRQQLLKDSENEWGQVNRFFHRKDPKSREMFSRAKGDWEFIGEKLETLDHQLSKLVDEDQDRHHKVPYQDALSSLQNSILKLQTTAIDYTKEWIALEQNGTTTSSISAPTGLGISNVTNTGWTVSWTGVSGAISYDVYLNGSLYATDVTDTSYTFTGKNSNTNYTVTVTAVNASGQQSVPSSPVSLTTSTMNLSVSNVTSSGWTLNWTPVSGAQYYVIYVGNSPVVSNVTSTSYTLTGENANTTYTVSVRAFNAAGYEISQTNTSAVTTLS